MRLKLVLLIVSLLYAAGLLKGQNVEYGAGIDTTYMLIGDQQHLTFKVRSDVPLQVVFPRLKDTVSAGIEIISGPVRDSVKENDGKWLFQERYVITVFDTGVYVIPAMPITVETESYNNVLRTDPLSFIVNTYKVDEQQGFNDIVMPYQAPWTFTEILPYVLWSLLGMAVIVLVVWLIVRSRKNKPLFKREEVVIPPYVKAIQSLDELKASKLWQGGRVKEYYTKLTDTVRQYMGDELGIAAMEQTSFETIRSLENNQEVDAQDKEFLAVMLQTADFVKFAKATPLPDENARNLNIAYDFVNNTNKRIKAKNQVQQEQTEQMQQTEKQTEKTEETD